MLTIIFSLLAYLSGSVLYASIFGNAFGKKAFYQNSADHNPGTANAYKYCGFWCGTLTLVCDLLKGFLPVFLYLRLVPDPEPWALSLVLAAPVVGHIFPVFQRFHGGKGIATTFGCLLGLLPYGLPALLLAVTFIFLSVVLRITPHFYRTIAAYLSAALAMILLRVVPAVWIGFLAITAAVCLRLYLSEEEKERFEVKLLWMR